MVLKSEFYTGITINGWKIYPVPEENQHIGEGIHILRAAPVQECIIFSMVAILDANKNIFRCQKKLRWSSKNPGIDYVIEKSVYVTNQLLIKGGQYVMPLRVVNLNETHKKLVFDLLKEMDDQVEFISSSILNYGCY